MQIASSRLLPALSITTAALLGASPTVAAEFTSGSHVINSTIDGVLASGPDTVVTIEASAVVNAIPGYSRGPFSLAAEDGAQIIINGGTFVNRVDARTGANLEINGGIFDQVFSSSSIQISDGLFQGRVIAFGEGRLDIRGGDFRRSVGFDSSLGAVVNIFVDSVAFSELSGEDIPYDALGTTITLTDLSIFEDDGGVTGKYADQSPFGFGLFFDGAGGAINIRFVPEPATLGLSCLAGGLLVLRRRQVRCCRPHGA